MGYLIAFLGTYLFYLLGCVVAAEIARPGRSVFDRVTCALFAPIAFALGTLMLISLIIGIPK